MSDIKSKTVSVEDLDFGDISGGVEEKAGVAPLEKAEAAPASSFVSESLTLEKPLFEKDSFVLPIPNSKGSYTLKLIEEVSGEEFLRWAVEVYPPAITSKMNPVSFDGPSKISARKNAVEVIARYHHDMMKSGVNRKVKLDLFKQ